MGITNTQSSQHVHRSSCTLASFLLQCWMLSSAAVALMSAHASPLFCLLLPSCAFRSATSASHASCTHHAQLVDQKLQYAEPHTTPASKQANQHKMHADQRIGSDIVAVLQKEYMALSVPQRNTCGISVCTKHLAMGEGVIMNWS